MRVLLSIKPKYSKRIFSGEKRYEFRKIKPKSTIDFVVVYESSPTCHIVGGFTVKKIISGNPQEIWERCQDSSGIEKNLFEKYCSKTEKIHAIEIDRAYKLKEPMNPFKLFSDFKPPQSFCYLNHSSINEMSQMNARLEHQEFLESYDSIVLNNVGY